VIVLVLICLYVCFLQLLKVDVQTKKCLEWIEEGCHCSEPIFVPKPDAQDEDEGTIFGDILVLSSFCHFGSHCYTVLLFWPVEFSPLYFRKVSVNCILPENKCFICYIILNLWIKKTVIV